MKIEILHFDGCPTYKTTGDTLRQVLAEEGLEALVCRVYNTPEGLMGSPTAQMLKESLLKEGLF
jgi:hypothetical protein